jgi:dihydroorotate dehydrogenase electron transfer subunit
MTPLRWEIPSLTDVPSVPTARLAGKVVHRERVGSMVLTRLRLPGWRAGLPGQFAMVQPWGSSRFLPRAFSLHDQEGEDVSFLVSPVGAGSEEISELDLGERALVLGPLGRGFAAALPLLRRGTPSGSPGPAEAGAEAGPRAGGPVAAQRLLLVAGGAGVAPFPLVMRALADQPAARRPQEISEVVLLLGFRDDLQAEALHLFGEPAEALRAAGIPVRVEAISEDGALGRAGLVTTLLREELRPGDLVLACGAHVMCEAVWDLCLQAEAEAWFSLEAGMACGTGSCQGCVIELADGSLAKVCRQGPVFSGREAFGSERHPCSVPRS